MIDEIEINALAIALRVTMMTTLNTLAAVVAGGSPVAMRSFLDEQRDVALGALEGSYRSPDTAVNEAVGKIAAASVRSMFDHIHTDWPDPTERPRLHIVK